MVISLTPLPPQLSTWFMNDPFKQINTDIEDLRSKTNSFECSSNVPQSILDAITSLTTDVSAIKSDISILKEDVSEMKTDISDLKTDISMLKEDVSEMKTDISMLKEDVSTLKANVTILQTEVDSLKPKVMGLCDTVSNNFTKVPVFYCLMK